MIDDQAAGSNAPAKNKKLIGDRGQGGPGRRFLRVWSVFLAGYFRRGFAGSLDWKSWNNAVR